MHILLHLSVLGAQLLDFRVLHLQFLLVLALDYLDLHLCLFYAFPEILALALLLVQEILELSRFGLSLLQFKVSLYLDLLEFGIALLKVSPRALKLVADALLLL